MERWEFDYVIIGGGAAGAVLAHALAGRTSGRVALLEAGPSDEGRAEVLDFRRYKEVTASPLARLLPIVAPAIGNGRFRYPTSRILGGSTSQNTCIWFRPPASDFEDWKAAGAAGWGADDVGPHFDALERRIHIETELPEGEGHLRLWGAARDLGFPTVDFSMPFGEGMGAYRMSKAGTQRQSSSVVFLHPLPALPDNLAVFTDTPATGLLFGPTGEACGVSTVRGEFLARSEVVLAAGALDTPKLLMLSGIGPAEHLASLGIAVRHDLPVGTHLLDHPAACVNVAAQRPMVRSPLWNYSGVLFARTANGQAWPDVEMQLGPELFEQQTAPAGYPSSEYGFTAYMTVNRARSEGTVRLGSADADDPPLIDPAYFTDPDGYDLGVMVDGIKLARRLFSTPSLEGWTGPELAPGASCTDEAALAAYVRETATTGYHPAGTCRMGAANDRRSVVDPELRVIGIRRLRIADASIMPRMVSVNIAPTCMMIGRKAAEAMTAGPP